MHAGQINDKQEIATEEEEAEARERKRE